jgi:hypothetical protein
MKLARQVPFYYYLILLAATAIVVGIQWDISWHSSIGRDKLLSPPHVVVYMGGVICGLICTYIVFKETFFTKFSGGVRFWGFQAPLACWICIWGMIAMLASAPFDDWWHNAYGLDVQIISPPHIILAMGIFSVILGSCILILTKKNINPSNVVYDILYIYAASLILVQFSIILTEYSFTNKQHSYEFYKMSSIFYSFVLIAFKIPSKYKFSATYISIAYMFHRMLIVWILPLFSAEPLLGPIHREVTSYVAPYFPVLLFIPALIIDLLYPKIQFKNIFIKSVVIASIFSFILLIIQWNFSIFLLSDYAKNWFFASDNNVPYFIPVGPWEGKFFLYDITPYGGRITLGTMSIINFIKICIYSTFSVLIAFQLSNWLKEIKR